MSAALATQTAQRGLLVASAAVTALVPVGSILDTGTRPEGFPRIIVGEDQELPADEVVGRYTTIFSTLHIWSRGDGLAGAKAIAGVVRSALHMNLWHRDGYRCIDAKFQNARYVRDPDGVTAHGIVTIQSVVEAL
jgi:hypothetical protein